MTESSSGRAIKTTGAVTIRQCEALAEMQACFALQREVWKFSDADLIPVRMFVVATKIGGQVIGAFDANNNDLIGFAIAIPGTRNGHSYLHSHMLAVRQEYRNAGLGRKLKLSQRDDALARGFELMEWTFDPLEIKNAYLNIEKLGAISRRYNVNQYGITSSPLQGGLPTDRLVDEVEAGRRNIGGLHTPKLRMPKTHRGPSRELRMEDCTRDARAGTRSAGKKSRAV
jgi:predicted GNAT superfamily acetyltransferase